jgi:hypothetical protein
MSNYIISKTKLRNDAPIANPGVNRRARNRRVDSGIGIVDAFRIGNILSIFACKEPKRHCAVYIEMLIFCPVFILRIGEQFALHTVSGRVKKSYLIFFECFRNYPGLFTIPFVVEILLIVYPVFSFPPSDDSALTQIAARIEKHVAILGSDQMKGRAVGTPEADLAAAYLAEQLAVSQVSPLPAAGSYFQNIPMHGSKALPGCYLQVCSDSVQMKLELYRDYVLYKTGVQTLIPNPAPLVFAGYGIRAPEYDYNDYHGLDVSGKIVVFLEGEPSSGDVNYFSAELPTIHSSADTKQRLAVAQGAIGSIIIPLPQTPLHQYWQNVKQDFSFEEVNLAYTISGHLSILIHPEIAALLFGGRVAQMAEITDYLHGSRLTNRDLPVKISFHGAFKERNFIGKNVCGLINGNDERFQDSYLIISAHYDHLGVGFPVNQDSIYNGVVDNAIGVSGVLELARMISANRSGFKRSVIFLLVTGEEKGVLGSRYYVDHPLVPLHKTIAALNVDGLAIFDKFNDVVGVGGGMSGLGRFVEQAAGDLGLQSAGVPAQFLEFESFSRSDQVMFAEAGVPSILINEGLNYRNLSPDEGLEKWLQWNDLVYHSPFDDLNQPINFEAAAQHVQFLYHFCEILANTASPPEWNSDAPFYNARLRSIAEKR